jgi:hypothetical protein
LVGRDLGDPGLIPWFTFFVPASCGTNTSIQGGVAHKGFSAEMGYFQVGKFNGGSESIVIEGSTSRDEPGLQARDALAGDRMRS